MFIEEGMKKINILIASLAAVLSFSCSDDIAFPEQDNGNRQPELVPMTLSTTVELTRTSLSGTQVNWNEDDVIAVFDDLNYSNRFEAVEVNGPEAVFEGLVNARTTDVYAVYPYSEEVRATSEAIHVKLDDDQTPVSGTFAEECNISVAHSVKDASADVVEDVVFKNVCGLIKFTVPERFSNITSVSLTTDRNIAGDLLVRKSDMGVEVEGNGSRTVSMTGSFATGSTFYFVVTPGEITELTLKLILDGSVEYSKVMPASAAFTLGAGEIKNLGNIDFTPVPSAVAEHTYDASGVLTGTKVTLNLGLPAGLEQYVENLNANVVRNGTEYRRVKNSSGQASVTLETVNALPYIPQGEYDVWYEYTFNGVTEERTIKVTVPAPTFKVTTSAYTSYSRYLEGTDSGIIAANSCDAETIYDIQCTVGISDAILKDYRYGYISSCDVTLKNPSGSTVSVSGIFDRSDDLCFIQSQQTAGEWGTYTLTAKVTFDGVTITGPTRTLHITGLPYAYDFYNKDASMLNQAGWTNKVEFTNNKCAIQYDGSDGHLISPRFHIPNTFNMSYDVQAQYYRAWTINVESKKINLHVGATSSTSSVASSYNSHECAGNNSLGKTFSTISSFLQVSEENPYVSLHHNNANISAQVDYLCIYQVTFGYHM